MLCRKKMYSWLQSLVCACARACMCVCMARGLIHWLISWMISMFSRDLVCTPVVAMATTCGFLKPLPRPARPCHTPFPQTSFPCPCPSEITPPTPTPLRYGRWWLCWALKEEGLEAHGVFTPSLLHVCSATAGANVYTLGCSPPASLLPCTETLLLYHPTDSVPLSPVCFYTR